MIGAYMGKLKGSLNIPIETLSKISNFYLTKKDGSPVPTTTISSEDKYLTDEERVLATIISSEDKKWAGTPPVSLTQAAEGSNKINEIDGIPVCTDTEYDLGDIKRGSSASVIFRFDKREAGYSYIVVQTVYGHSVSCKEIRKYGYYDVRVTYKHPGFLGDKGAFRVPIRIELHRADDRVEYKTVYITGNVK